MPLGSKSDIYTSVGAPYIFTCNSVKGMAVVSVVVSKEQL